MVPRGCHIVLRGHWCISLFRMCMHQVREKVMIQRSFYEELEQVFFYHFLKYRVTIILGDFYAKVGRKNIFKTTTGNESLHQDRNDNGVRTVNFATSKYLIVKAMMFQHLYIHKYTWTSLDGKTHNQIDHILIDRRWQSSILEV